MYEIGKVYIWVKNGEEQGPLLGTETTVTHDLGIMYNVKTGISAHCYGTDSISPINGRLMVAGPGDLRPKNPPDTGEQQIVSMFKKTPELEPA